MSGDLTWEEVAALNDGAAALPTEMQALAARDEALALVDDNADPAWKEAAYRAVLMVARTNATFISDDVWEQTSLPPAREDRALGPVFLRAARDGMIRKTDRVRPSKRSHYSGKPVWESLIFERHQEAA